MKFSIDKKVTDTYPHLIAALVIVKGFTNSPSKEVSDQILSQLRENESVLQKQFPDKETLLSHPYAVSYLEFFKKFGVNPKKVKPSHVALTERVVRGGNLPDINPAVNLYNAFSIKYITPFGGEDLDMLDTYFSLTFAKGDEKWIGIGETEAISPKVGDLIWKDKSSVSTLSLNWRQCDKTKLTESSTNGYFIMEGFDEVNQEHIIKTAHEFIDTFTSLLGGHGNIYLLSKGNDEITI